MKKDAEIVKTLVQFQLPTYEEIPDIGLYLDQVVKYINSYFASFPEMHVTSSMLTNYVKQKVVKRYNKKTYIRDQIACFFLIAMAKTVLSIDNIKLCLDENKEDTYQEEYNNFRSHMHLALESLGVKTNTKHQNSDDMNYYITTAIAHKMYLERKFAMYKEQIPNGK